MLVYKTIGWVTVMLTHKAEVGRFAPTGDYVSKMFKFLLEHDRFMLDKGTYLVIEAEYNKELTACWIRYSQRSLYYAPYNSKASSSLFSFIQENVFLCVNFDLVWVKHWHFSLSKIGCRI